MHRTWLRTMLMMTTVVSWSVTAYGYEGGPVSNGGSISG